MTRRASFSFPLDRDDRDVVTLQDLRQHAGALVVLAARMVSGRGVSLRGSRVSAVTGCLRANASSRMRLPILPLAPIGAMLVGLLFRGSCRGGHRPVSPLAVRWPIPGNGRRRS